jgi:NAD(P)-dependent dehydrogenase (short-subunit alcohol dehydrogenase family)
MVEMRLEGRVAIVTGGGRGIGEAIALAFAREGANLILAARTQWDIERVAQIAQSMGRQALAVQTDVCDQNSVSEMTQAALDSYGHVDVLVNNAGVLGPIGPVVVSDPAGWMHTIQVNLVGVYLCSRAVLPHMMRERRGKIINLSGGGATSPRPFFSAYGASKAAVVRLTETLAEEVKEFNIQINAIAPGAVNTRMLDELLDTGTRAGDAELQQAQEQKQRGGVPSEKAAALAVFLASSESDGVTGRLISAVWDDWRSLPHRLDQIADSDVYTLRRIVPGDRGLDWER